MSAPGASTAVPGWCLRASEAFERAHPDDPFAGRRREAIARLGELGFPTQRNEEWRFTSVAPLAKTEFLPPPGLPSVRTGEAEHRFIGGLARNRLVFIDGWFAPALSTIAPTPGLAAGPIGGLTGAAAERVGEELGRIAPADADTFTALNTGFLRAGAAIVAGEGAAIDEPVYVVYLSSGGDEPFVSHPRLIVLAGRGARLAVVEHYASLGRRPGFTNAVVEASVADGASVEITKLQDEDLRQSHIGSLWVRLGRASRFTSNLVSFGGLLVRNNIAALFTGEEAECTLNGLSLASGLQHVDNHTVIDHAVPRCASHELYKAILDGKSKGVFNGKIFVRKDAQKTDAKQTNRTLLLSEDATMNAKPQLEIFADDVKCTHGAAIGSLDAEALLYLRSRGIGTEEARDILTFAFANDVTGRIGARGVRDILETALRRRLARRHKEEQAS